MGRDDHDERQRRNAEYRRQDLMREERARQDRLRDQARRDRIRDENERARRAALAQEQAKRRSLATDALGRGDVDWAAVHLGFDPPGRPEAPPPADVGPEPLADSGRAAAPALWERVLGLSPLAAPALALAETPLIGAGLAWTRVDGADGYALERAASADFSGATEVYRGPSTVWRRPGRRALPRLSFDFGLPRERGFFRVSATSFLRADGPWSNTIEVFGA